MMSGLGGGEFRCSICLIAINELGDNKLSHKELYRIGREDRV